MRPPRSSRQPAPAPSDESAQPAGPTAAQPAIPPAALPTDQSLVLIVTGSTIAAETRDRPLAYRLRERMLAWLDARAAAEDATRQASSDAKGAMNGSIARLQPVVCSDLWYLNARELAERPMVSVGEPHSNAATAVVSSRLPTAFVIEGSLRVHLDPEFIDLRAAIWGANAGATAAAIDLFAERYMSEFLGAA